MIEVPFSIQSDDMEECFLEIFASPDSDELVTAIELLSLSNKREGNPGRELYQKKQDEILNSKVNLVEIDLLRGGAHTTLVPRELLQARAGEFDYHVCVHMMDQRDRCLVHAWNLEVRLPAIEIPLLPGDSPITIDLQPILDECFEASGYQPRMRYRKWKPKPRFTREQNAWAEKILKAHGI